MRIALSTVICLLCMAPGARAEEAALDPLVSAVKDCPLALIEAMAPAQGRGHKPLGAEFVLDRRGRLILWATVRVAETDDAWFERWTGTVHAGGWVPHKQRLTEGAAFDEAARHWALLEKQPGLIRHVLETAVRTDDRAGPAELAFSIHPVQEQGDLVLDLRVLAKGELRGLRFQVETSTFELRDAEADPARIDYQAPAMPPLKTADGTWFNVEQAPSLDALRGKPVLVVVTDPG